MRWIKNIRTYTGGIKIAPFNFVACVIDTKHKQTVATTGQYQSLVSKVFTTRRPLAAMTTTCNTTRGVGGMYTDMPPSLWP